MKAYVQQKSIVKAIRHALTFSILGTGLSFGSTAFAEDSLNSVNQSQIDIASLPSVTLDTIVVTAKTYEGYAEYAPTSGTKTNTEC